MKINESRGYIKKVAGQPQILERASFFFSLGQCELDDILSIKSNVV